MVVIQRDHGAGVLEWTLAGVYDLSEAGAVPGVGRLNTNQAGSWIMSEIFCFLQESGCSFY